MRAHKYRAWHTVHKKMFSPEEMGIDQLTLMPDGQGFINVHGSNTRLSQFMPHMIPLQYTGLQDKNGKGIYEEDIIQWWNKISSPEVVKATNGGWNPFIDNCTTDHSYHYIIIGNTYENPELLKEAE